MDDYKNPQAGKTYISPKLDAFRDSTKKVRIASKLIESPDAYTFVKVKDEVVLRHKENAKSYITAKFIEDSRDVFVLNIQKYTVGTDNPHSLSFSFVNEEIGKLLEFIHNIQSVNLDRSSPMNIKDEELKKIILSDSQAKKIIQENHELLTEVLRSEVTKEDIISVGFRKKQLEWYEKLLNDSKWFEEIKDRKKTTNEGLWQYYFEKNPWIFGYGLGYIFIEGLDDKKLEQVVQGHNVNSHGKRVDALMKTKGIISNLCFVEIKTHTTQLLDSKPYRTGCWAPSKELAGAIAQVQGTVASAVDSLTNKVSVNDKLGNPKGEDIYNYQPKAYLVIGNMGEFLTENGINKDKLRSFELFRKNISSPEIITFDELYERARFIVLHNQNQQGAASE
ncbi:Shedu immune nuclease family protein [Psychrobacter sp. AT9]|uniref:Shedu immune nuclease family protein n=1 Tax=Psychrobacter sp. AT9 TaxID=3242893 RepID=UPI0039A66056